MRKIKFSYIFQHEETGRFVEHIYTLQEISELGSVHRLNRHVLITTRQYTGLKDKNGKEIYEGDIVKWVSMYKCASKKSSIDVIRWDEETVCFLLLPCIHEPHAAEMEIIGNIYENPELLKEASSESRTNSWR